MTPQMWNKAIKLLKEAAGYLCSADPEQGDYCRCGAYVGAGEDHNKGCLYLCIQKFLKEAK